MLDPFPIPLLDILPLVLLELLVAILLEVLLSYEGFTLGWLDGCEVYAAGFLLGDLLASKLGEWLGVKV